MSMTYDDGTPMDPLDALAIAADEARERYQALRRQLIDAAQYRSWPSEPPAPGMVLIDYDGWVPPDAADEYRRVKEAADEAVIAALVASAEAVTE